MAADVLHEMLAQGLMEGLVNAFQKGAGSLQKKYGAVADSLVQGLVKQLSNKKSTGALTESLVSAINSAVSSTQNSTKVKPFKMAPVSVQLRTDQAISGMSRLSQAAKKHATVIETLFERLPPDVTKNPGARATMHFLSGLERKFTSLGGAVAGSLGAAFLSVGSLVGRITPFAALLSIPLAAAVDLQGDLKKIIVQDTGKFTKAYESIYSSIDNASAATGIAQDRVVELANALSDAGLLTRNLGESMDNYLVSAANWMKVYGYSADETGRLVYGLHELGVELEDSNKIVNGAFEIGKSYNLSLQEIRESTLGASEVMTQWGMAGVEATQTVVSGLLRARGLYKELGISGSVVDQVAKKMGDLTNPESIRALAFMSMQTGNTINELNKLRKNDFGAFMIERANAGLKYMADTAASQGLSADVLFGNQATWDDYTERFVQTIKKQMKDNLLMTDEEADKLFTGMQKYAAEKLPQLLAQGVDKQRAMVMLQQQYLQDIQKRNRKEADSNKSLDDVNKMWTTILGHIRSIGHSLLVVVGMPLMRALEPAIAAIAWGLKLAAGTLEFMSGPIGLIAKGIGYIAVAIGGVVTATTLFKTGLAAINFIIGMNPIVRVVMLVVAAFALLYEHWDKIKEIAGKVGTTIVDFILIPVRFWKAVTGEVIGLLSRAWESISGNPVVKAILKPLEAVRSAIQSIWQAFTAVGEAIVSRVMAPIKALKGWIDKIDAVFKWWKGESVRNGKIEATKKVVQQITIQGAEKVFGADSKITRWTKGLMGLSDDAIARNQKAIRDAASSSSSKLGSLSAKYESGPRGSAAIGYDSRGGTSYGTYQISQQTGTLDQFMAFMRKKDKQLYDQLSPLKMDSYDKKGKFAKKWVEMAEAGLLKNLEHDFIKGTHFNPAVEGAQKLGLDTTKMSKTMQDVFWSRSVQLGDHFNSLLGDLGDLSKYSEEELIGAIYDRSGRYFSRATPEVRANVQSRFTEEKTDALARLAAEQRRSMVVPAGPTTAQLNPEAQQAIIELAQSAKEANVHKAKHDEWMRAQTARNNMRDYGVFDAVGEGGQ